MNESEREMRLYYSELIERFRYSDDLSIDIDELNELAAALADADVSRWLWSALLDLGASEMSEHKRERLAIAIYELLAEPPAHPLWIESLIRIITDESLRWIAVRAYVGCPESFYPDFCAAGDATAREEHFGKQEG